MSTEPVTTSSLNSQECSENKNAKTMHSITREVESNQSDASSEMFKTTRVRTVLSDKQVAIMKTCYSTNPRPDSIMKERLAELTGLSLRVIRVWFQNKRCKDKKKSVVTAKRKCVGPLGLQQVYDEKVSTKQGIKFRKNKISMTMLRLNLRLESRTHLKPSPKLFCSRIS